MRLITVTLGLAGLGLLLVQCGPKAGVIGPAGFAQETYHYNVSYRDPVKKLFLPADWQLDNYYDYFEGTWKPKEGPAYQAVREFDANGDGTISESEKNSEFIYDLRFTHTKDDGIIWIKAHPVAASDARRDLDVELNDYADGMAGTGLYAQGNLFSLEKLKARTYTTFVTSRQPIKVGSLTGLVGEIEIAEIERLRLDPKHRSGKLRVVLARFIYEEQDNSPASATDQTGLAHIGVPGAPAITRDAGATKRQGGVVWRNGLAYRERTGLLVAGYYNTMSRFDEHVKDFDQILGQLSLTTGSSAPEESGVNIRTPAASSASPPAAPATPPDAGRSD
jgi:hypothetical protein